MTNSKRAMSAGATIVRYRGVVKRYGSFPGAGRRRPRRARGRGRVPDRAVGFRQVDAASLHERPRIDRRRRHRVRRRDAAAGRARAARRAPAHGHGVPELRAVSASDRAGERGRRSAHRAADGRGRSRPAGDGDARESGPGRQGGELSGGACRADSSNASRSRARWRWSRT